MVSMGFVSEDLLSMVHFAPPTPMPFTFIYVVSSCMKQLVSCFFRMLKAESLQTDKQAGSLHARGVNSENINRKQNALYELLPLAPACLLVFL